MKIITRQVLAEEAAARWKKQNSGCLYRKNWKEVHAQLQALPNPVDPGEVDRILGNTSWTTPPACNVCGKYHGPVIEVGEEPDYESSTAYLCFDCVRKVAQVAAEFEASHAAREVDPRQLLIPGAG